MPIYEFACPRCRRIYSFLSKRVNPAHRPTCPKCGSTDLSKEVSGFALITGAPEPAPAGPGPGADSESALPDLEDPRVARAMNEMERDMDHLDENNPRHMAHLLRKMKDVLPPGAMPKEMDIAIRRLEAGEDPDKIEEDMGDLLAGALGEEGPESPGGAGAHHPHRPYTRDSGLYDY